MKFFNLDLHISVIEDIKTILEKQGHQVVSKSISGHNWVFNREPAQVDVVNQETWKNLDQKMADEFYERYKDELSEYDGFIVTYPPTFAILFEKFDKPIIAVAATRYEAPCSQSEERWNWVNRKLIEMIDRGQLIAVANNKYDKHYCEYFLQRDWKHIPSICEYTGAKYTGTREQSIVSGRTSLNAPDVLHITQIGRHSWQDLYSYKSIIHIPYNASLMSIFEQYTANVPLIFPTKGLAIQLPSFMREAFFPGTMLSNKEFEYFASHDRLDLADFYDEEWMPHLLYFNNFEKLESILSSDLSDTSEKMKKFNVERIGKIEKLWEETIGSITT